MKKSILWVARKSSGVPVCDLKLVSTFAIIMDDNRTIKRSGNKGQDRGLGHNVEETKERSWTKNLHIFEKRHDRFDNSFRKTIGSIHHFTQKLSYLKNAFETAGS